MSNLNTEEDVVDFVPNYGPRSISDDDLCSQCANCSDPAGPLSLSRCRAGFPGTEDSDGYIRLCPDFT